MMRWWYIFDYRWLDIDIDFPNSLESIRWFNSFAYNLQNYMDDSGSYLYADTWNTNRTMLYNVG